MRKEEKAVMCGKLRTIICDSNEEVRFRVRSYLQAYGKMSVIAEASDQDMLILLSQQYAPDLILVNWMMESLCVKSFISLVKKLNPLVKILFFSADENYQEIVECIDSDFFSNVCLSNELATKLFDRSADDDRVVADNLFLNNFSLSNRELEVLKLLASGRSNGQISKELFISLPTTKTHVRNILGKLGVEDRTQAAIKAIKFGIEPELGNLVTV